MRPMAVRFVSPLRGRPSGGAAEVPNRRSVAFADRLACCERASILVRDNFITNSIPITILIWPVELPVPVARPKRQEAKEFEASLFVRSFVCLYRRQQTKRPNDKTTTTTTSLSNLDRLLLWTILETETEIETVTVTDTLILRFVGSASIARAVTITPLARVRSAELDCVCVLNGCAINELVKRQNW